MRTILIFLPLALLVPPCSGQEPRSGPQALRTGCSSSDEQLGMISLDDPVQVTQALAGGEETCYKVTLTRGGQAVTGYVLGDALPAVAAFLNQQAKYRDAAFIAQEQERARQEELARAQAAAQAAAKAKAAAQGATAAGAKLNPDLPANFEEFSGRDTTGKPVSLSGLGGRVILVTFWSPRSASSKGQLMTLLPLYNRYKGAGLRAVGVGMDPNPARLANALDDVTLAWPQIPDRSGMAKRYGVNPATGTTLVLDASHHIIAAGLTPSELDKKVRELLAAP
jgi:peroxiredoxin